MSGKWAEQQTLSRQKAMRMAGLQATIHAMNRLLVHKRISPPRANWEKVFIEWSGKEESKKGRAALAAAMQNSRRIDPLCA
jgi:hypothetical protein